MVAANIALTYYGGKWLLKKSDQTVEELGADAAQKLIDEGLPLIENYIEFWTGVYSKVGEGILEVIRGSAPAIIDAGSLAYARVSNEIADRRVETVAVMWALLIYVMTAVTIYKSLKSE